MSAPRTELSAAGIRLVDKISTAATRRRQATEQLWTTVATAREAGVPWRIIGTALGVSTQAAQERFSKPPPGQLL